MVGLFNPPLSAPPTLHTHTTNSSLSSYSSHHTGNPRSTHPSSIASSSTPGFRDFDDGLGGELGNFEEIGLGDDSPVGRKGHDGLNGVIGGGRNLLGQQSRKSNGGMNNTTLYGYGRTGGLSISTFTTPYPNGTPKGYSTRDPRGEPKGRPILPGLNTKTTGTIVGKEQPYLHAPGTNGTRRSNSPTPRSRGPSPRRSTPPSPALSAMSLPASQNSGSSLPKSTGFAGFKQRPSWQGQRRKTAAELEDEVDSDDDVPDDAVFWNVPISPRAGIRRNSTQGGSPDRYRKTLAVGNEKMNTRNGHHGASRPPTRGSSADGPEDERGRSQQQQFRSKSWSDAMSELGQDAKELTEALETYAEQMENGNISKPMAPPPPQRPHTITLPPVQAPNNMIDPLPISKEKEKVLSRTRPSWLPPKDRSEEKRHLKEYKRMMAAAQASEQRKKERALLAAEASARALEELQHHWASRIIPSFSHAITLPSTRELWWRGVPPDLRGSVWSRAITNSMLITPETFSVALSSSHQLRQSLTHSNTLSTDRDRHTFNSILSSISALTPEFEDISLARGFEPNAFSNRLRDVLFAYAWYRRDVGYAPGITSIAALLLLNMPKVDAFIALANLLNHPLPLSFLTGDEVAINKIYGQTLELLAYKLPRLHGHLTKTLKLRPEDFLEPLFCTAVTFRVPVEVQERLWDVYVFERDAFLIRAVVGMLGVLEGRLYGSRDEVLREVAWGAEKRGRWGLNVDQVMNGVRSAGKVEGDE